MGFRQKEQTDTCPRFLKVVYFKKCSGWFDQEMHRWLFHRKRVSIFCNKNLPKEPATYLHHFDLPEDKAQHEAAIDQYLRTSNYGRCVYRMDNDEPDHYTCNILFDEDITVAFSMEAFTSYSGRETRIMGSMGDIVGDMNTFTLTDFKTGKKTEWKQESDGHGGGDWRLVNDWVKAIAANDPNLLTSTIDESIESHIMGFAAEKSRKSGQSVKIKV